MVLNLFRKVVDVVVLNPFQTKVVSGLVVFDVREIPPIGPEDSNPNWSPENVEEGPPKGGVVLNHGNVEKVPFVFNHNFEGNIGPEAVILTSGLLDLDVEHTVETI